MLNITQEAVLQIMKQETPHSWMKPIAEAVKDDELKENTADSEIHDWTQKVVDKQIQIKVENNYYVVRMVRDALLMTLERKAISKFLETNNQWADLIPEVTDPQEAVLITAMDIMYLSKEEKDEAAKILTLIDEGQIEPTETELQEILNSIART